MTSIRRKLLLTLIGALLAAGFTTAAATFFSAQAEFNDFLDTHLKETAESLAESVRESFPTEAPSHLTIVGDAPTYKIVVQVYDSANNGLWQREGTPSLPLPDGPGFASVQVDGKQWRTYSVPAGPLVITVGQRGGHPSRSKWYHNYGYGNMRDYPLADHKRAIEQLAARHSFIDITRVGIHGHSGGGFMSTAAMFQYPDFFKAAVSCAGNHDNRIYNRWWSETHHGVKEVVSEQGDTTVSYKIATNPEIAARLKGHLLLVHGDIDNNVHPANTLRVVNALIRAGKRFDMLILPGQRHGFGDMDEYFYWRLVDYFSLHLLGAQETSVDLPRR